jgi:hypothetical protein
VRADDGSGRFVACPLTYAHRNFAVGVFVSTLRSFPMKKIRAFAGKDGLFYCVTTSGDRVFGPYTSVREVKASAPLIRDHERSNEAARKALTPQPLDAADVLDAYAG